MKKFKSFLVCVTCLFLTVTLYANSQEWDSQILLENASDSSPWIEKVEMLSESSTNGFNVMFIQTTSTANRSWLYSKEFSIEEDTVILELFLDGNDNTEGRTWIDTFEIGELQIGAYILKVKVYSKDGNNEATTTFNLGVSGFNMNNDQDEILCVYPNPSTDFLIIESSDINITGNIEIIDSKGSLLKTSHLNQGKLDISGLPNGIYIMKFHLGELTESKKIVISR